MSKIGNFNDKNLRRFVAFVLVGTLATGFATGRVMFENNFSRQAYYDEDVKANKERLERMIREGGSSKTKTLGNRESVIPTKTMKV